MPEYCPECGFHIGAEVGFGCECKNCGWCGVIASNHPRRDTRRDNVEEPVIYESNKPTVPLQFQGLRHRMRDPTHFLHGL